MIRVISTLIVFVAALCIESALADNNQQCGPLLDHNIKELASERQVNLCTEYRGKVVLIVNTASKCVYTPQYTGLEALYEKYRERGLVVAGFPSNDFGAQEPGTEKVIKDFCELTYGVRFPMYEKTRVTKNYADPLYQALAKAANGEYPRWNFHKYLIDRNGRLAGSFQSHVRPDDSKLVTAIDKLL
jgi:glutathione peroxidase